MNEHAENEDQLVEQARGGDRAACAELFRSYQDYIFNAVHYMVRDHHSVEDLTQMVFVKALENLPSFEGRASFGTWLYAIMLNTVRTYRRNRARSRTFDTEDCEFAPTQHPGWKPRRRGPGEELVASETVDAVRACIDALPDDYRDIIVLRDIEGLSYQDLAAVLDVSLGTVKSRLARARSALKQRLTDSRFCFELRD